MYRKEAIVSLMLAALTVIAGVIMANVSTAALPVRAGERNGWAGKTGQPSIQGRLDI